jgi:retron-type reverse transcriptase
VRSPDPSRSRSESRRLLVAWVTSHEQKWVNSRERRGYELAKENDGAPGVDGVTFEAIEAESVDAFLDELREGLVQRRYRPQRPRKVGIPKEGGKFRQLSIPSIRDRVVDVRRIRAFR